MRVLVCCALVVAGCGRGGAVDAGLDAGLTRDVPAPLDVPGADVMDAPVDTRVVPDAPGTDAPTALDAPSDVPVDAPADVPTDAPADAPVDASTTDAGSDAGAGGIVACAPVVPSGASSGLVCNDTFWPGFQFEVRATAHLFAVGVQGHVDASVDGTVHVTVYRLTGSGVAPDVAAPSAVVAPTLIALPGGIDSAVVPAPADAVLDPGWYALVVGTGAYGATATSATIPSGGGSGCISLPGSGYPFTIRRTDGSYILQGASPHLFVGLD